MSTIEIPSRGEQTRIALIEAAIKVFGRSGFDAATTRALADAAGVNQALIGYHFGGKRGLYLAVFEHIVSQMQSRLAPVAEQVLAELDSLPVEDGPRQEAAVELLLTVLGAFMNMFGSTAAPGWVPLVLREQQNPTEAFDLVYEQMLGRMLALVTQLVAIASGMDANSEACRVRAMMTMGQALVFQAARSATARHLSWDGLGPDNIATVMDQFRVSLETQFLRREPSR